MERLEVIKATLNAEIQCACGERFVWHDLDITSSRHFDVPFQVRGIARTAGWDSRDERNVGDVRDVCPDCVRLGETYSEDEIKRKLATVEEKPKAVKMSRETYRLFVVGNNLPTEITQFFGVPIEYDEAVPENRFRITV